MRITFFKRRQSMLNTSRVWLTLLNKIRNIHATKFNAQEGATILNSPLFFPTSRLSAQNRFLKAALSEYLASWNPLNSRLSGLPGDRLVNLYEKWGHAGYGMILTGNIHVDERHIEGIGNMFITQQNDSSLLRQRFREMVKAAKRDGALMVAQINHAGRQTLMQTNSRPLSVSDLQLKMDISGSKFGRPQALTTKQIGKEVVDKFVFTSKVCAEIGFDGIQLHAAHGYLLSQFLSPTTNFRSDQYGGSVKNRVRVLREIYSGIRKVVPKDFIVGIKINSVEFQNDGLTTTDAAEMCHILDEEGIDFIELSGGAYERFTLSHQRESTKAREAFFLNFSDQIKNSVNKAIIYVTGGFRSTNAMVKAIQNGSTHGIGLGRPTTQEPDLPKKLISGKSLAAQSLLIDENDYSHSNIACITQMRQMSHYPFGGNINHEIMDLSDQQTVKNFLSEIQNLDLLKWRDDKYRHNEFY